MAKYSVVEFEDGIHLVPTVWLNDDKTLCSWPTHLRKQYDVNNAVIRSTIPNSGGKEWEYLNVKRIFGTADSYEKGMEKLCLAEETSNIDETASSDDEAEVIRAKKRRREKARKHFTSTDEEIPDKQPRTKLQPFPIMSNFHKNQDKTSSSQRSHDVTRGTTSSTKENRGFSELKRSITGWGEFSATRGSEISSSERRYDVHHASQKEDRAFNELELSFTGPNKSLTESVNRGATGCNTSAVFPLSRTSKSQIPQNNVTGLKTHKARDDKDAVTATEGFQKIVLKKLNKLLYQMDDLHDRLAVLDKHGHNLPLDEFNSDDEKELGLPLQGVSELTIFEEKLKNSTLFAKMLTWLKRFCGTDTNSSTQKVLIKLVSNSLAQQYSWAGAKGKRMFKDLHLVRLVMKAVRVRVPGASDVIFTDIISKWLAQAKLRFKREVEKLEKQKKSGQASAENPIASCSKEAADATNRAKEAANVEESATTDSE
ncbi:uncharacterized protein LOC124411361 [Diprion similis]|uniref:uncharacterized protein LOC124411361 n=1 Tax=Diprion similis TaxID=362088 RepID=UPI001EF8E40B|nr:uncharacterized protein LOC124411361 [Diprion similis]